ncbi:MAG TPA: hypothetical protein VJ771_04055 [Candidatus Nitrosotalea sp.]|nr:hypothetical protein [Candidatus Nitrosotalea sp.]
MSEDKIRLVQSLIDSKKGDEHRLQQILLTLQQGGTLDVLDQNYLEEISKEVKIEDIPNPEHENLEVQEPLDSQVKQDENSPPLEDVPIHKSTSSRKKGMIIAAAVIATVVVTLVGLDAYSASTLQFRPDMGNQYQISPTAIHIQADVCNPSFFPATFTKYEITAFYNSEQIEKAEINGTTVSPKTMSTVDGVFALNAGALLRLNQENTTFNPTLAKITTTINAPIFGAIPFTVVKEYSAEQFQQVLKNGPPGSFSCS